jgi:hypothetical protein
LNRQSDEGRHSELPPVADDQPRQFVPVDPHNQPADGHNTEDGLDEKPQGALEI